MPPTPNSPHTIATATNEKSSPPQSSRHRWADERTDSLAAHSKTHRNSSLPSSKESTKKWLGWKWNQSTRNCKATPPRTPSGILYNIHYAGWLMVELLQTTRWLRSLRLLPRTKRMHHSLFLVPVQISQFRHLLGTASQFRPQGEQFAVATCCQLHHWAQIGRLQLLKVQKGQNLQQDYSTLSSSPYLGGAT